MSDDSETSVLPDGSADGSNSRLTQARSRSSNKLAKLAALGLGLALLVGGFLWLSTTNAPATPELAPIDPCKLSEANRPEGQTLDCPDREDVVDGLRHLQQQLKPELSRMSLGEWAPDKQQAIDDLEATAITAFEKSDYVDALASLTLAIDAAQHEINPAPGLMQQHLDNLIQAFDAGDVQAVQHAQFRANQMDSNHPVLNTYAPRIAVLGQVLDLQNTAAVAGAENRLAKELEALKNIVQLDPVRVEHKPRIAAIESELREQRFELAIQQAEAALTAGDLGKARDRVASARLEYADRNVSSLLARIEAAEAQRRMQSLLAKGRTARSSDDWTNALRHYSGVLNIDAANQEAVIGKRDAERLLAAFTSLDQHLKNPIRLATPRVAEHVKSELAALQSYRQESPRLAGLMTGIESVLDSARTPVEVAVVSDGNTHVEVRRVGIVGKHKRKVIQLTPGEYQLEGRRKGYKSKIVFLSVPLDVASVEVRVECNVLI